MLNLFHVVLYQPLFNVLMELYRLLGQDLGLAIIVLTVLIKLLLFPLSLNQLKAQRTLQRTQPEIQAIRAKFKDNKEEMNRAIMAYYKENKVNPLASCLPLLLQLPFLIAIYQVFIAGIVRTDTGILAEKQLNDLYPFLRDFFSTHPIHVTLLGVVNLAATKNIVLAVLAGAVTFWQTRMLSQLQPPKTAGAGSKDEAFTASMNRSTMFTMPLVTLYIAYRFPAGLALYWFVSTLFQVGQQYFFMRKHGPVVSPTVIEASTNKS